VLFVLDDEINLSICRLNAQALPGVEWELSLSISKLLLVSVSLDEIIGQHAKVLSIDPETGSKSTIDKTKNIVYLARRA